MGDTETQRHTESHRHKETMTHRDTHRESVRNAQSITKNQELLMIIYELMVDKYSDKKQSLLCKGR